MRLILASRSARRALLLREAGYAFDVCDPPFADPANPVQADNQTPQQIAINLAQQKTQSVVEPDLDASGALILAADTVCVAHDGSLLGTPLTADEAEMMLRSFVNRVHQVVSAVALRRGEQVITFADTAAVVFGRLDESPLADYLATDQWQGKAGGYNLTERQEAGWPIAVQGDPTTVVGLPMKKLAAALTAHGITPGITAA